MKQRPSGFAQWSFMSWPYLSLMPGHHGFTVTFPHSSLLPGRESNSLSVASTSLTSASKEASRQEPNLGKNIVLWCLYGRRRVSVSVNHGQTGSKPPGLFLGWRLKDGVGCQEKIVWRIIIVHLLSFITLGIYRHHPPHGSCCQKPLRHFVKDLPKTKKESSKRR